MKTFLIILFSILSMENWAAEKKDSYLNDVLPPYSISIVGNNLTNSIKISLSPARFLVTGEKIKVLITDDCGHLVFFEEYHSGVDFNISSTVTIYKTQFNSEICWSDGNNSYFNVEAYYDLNDGNPQATARVFI